MTPEQIAALRLVAEKATPGEWRPATTEISGIRYRLSGIEITCDEDMLQISGSGGAKSFTSYVFRDAGADDDGANIDFVCAAQPRTILALLAERDALMNVANDIMQIMETYREQDARGNVETPGALEHMGDVWKTLDAWDATLRAALNPGDTP